MKSTLFLAIPLALGACSFAARSPEMYRDDTGKALATKQNEIRACYDSVLKANPGAAGTVTVKFDVETEQGKIHNVTVDKTKTTAPDNVSECVTRNIDGLTLAPPDARKGEGMWTYEFQAPPPPAVPEKT
ncbi:MAG: AgmX/PglI C-terminal domain-containing protein [Polyangiaceae bacterium]